MTNSGVKIGSTTWKVFVFGVTQVRIFPHVGQNNSEYGQFLAVICIEKNHDIYYIKYRMRQAYTAKTITICENNFSR